MATNNQRREAARRQLEQQLAQRQREQSTQRGRMLFLSIGGSILVVILAVVLIAVFNSSGDDKSTAASPTSAAASGSAAASASSSRAPLPTRAPAPIPARDPKSTSGPCKYAETAEKITGDQSQYSFDVGLPPDPNPTPTAEQTATFTTNLGVIKATLDAKNAPCNVQAIAYLIQQKFYDGTACPRSANSDGFAIIQCGDPTGTSKGGPTFNVKDENLSSAKYTAGTIAMANGGADTNSGQFFFIPKDSTALQQNYTVIGHVTEGLDTLVKVAEAGDDGSNQAGGGRPNTDLIFQTVTVS